MIHCALKILWRQCSLLAGRIAVKTQERFLEIIDLVIGEGQTERAVGLDQRAAPLCEQLNGVHRPAFKRGEQDPGIELGIGYGLGHPVVQYACGTVEHGGIDLAGLEPAGLRDQQVLHAPLNAPHGIKTAIVCNIRGFAGPGGDCSQSRNDDQLNGRFRALCRHERRTVVEHFRQTILGRGIGLLIAAHEVDIARLDRVKGQAQFLKLRKEALLFEGREDRRAREVQDRIHSDDRAAGRENTHFTAPGGIA